MSTLTLEADTLGTAYTPKGDGVVLESTNGQISLQVRNLHTLERALAPPGLNVYSEGFATDQNVPATIFVRGQGGFAGFLDNDSATDGSAITLAAVGNARNGTLTYDSNAVYFTPNANYWGADAGFDYVVSSPTAGSATAQGRSDLPGHYVSYYENNSITTSNGGGYRLEAFRAAVQICEVGTSTLPARMAGANHEI